MLRILPWITDPAIDFIEGWIDSHPMKSQLKVFEFGTGNSTLWFLQKNCRVTTVDNNPSWTRAVETAAHAFNLSSHLTSYCAERPYTKYYEKFDYDIVFIDGRDRVSCLERVIDIGFPKLGILVLDNTERISTGQYKDYMRLLESFHLIHFEQPFVSGIDPSHATLKDKAGYKVGHRWITSVAFDPSYGHVTSAGKKL
jgi:predicted O-methyltransferase YrrM